MKGNVCFFNSNRKWGGGEKWHLEMAIALMTRGYNVTLACNPHSELAARARAAGIRTIRACISNLSFLNPLKILYFIGKFKSSGIDTLIINLPSDLKIAGFAARVAGGIRVVYRRGSAIPVKSSIFNRFIFKKYVDEVVVNSNETKRTILENNPALFPLEKIHVIYNGIDLERFDADQSEPICKRRGDEIVLAVAGRLSRQKGYDLLFEAIRKLKQTGLNFRLLIAGEGELKTDISRLAQDLGLSEHVSFLGFLENIKPLLESCDIFLLPSRWEGFGYVLVETMACRKPIIAFHASSNPEIVADGETGFLVRDFQTDEFAEMIFFLANNPQVRQQMGEKGRKRAEERFGLERAVTELTNLVDPKQRAFDS